MKQLQAVLAAAAGAAAAIPGMSALAALEVPHEADLLFDFVLAAFSAAVALTVYVSREKLEKLEVRRVVAIVTSCMLAVLGFFLLYVYLTSKVSVAYMWGDEPGRIFLPLGLPAEADALVKAAGSRSQLLSREGPDVLRHYISDFQIALTLMALLIVYTALVASLAAAFGVLGVRALKAGGEGEGGEEGGPAVA